MTVVLFGVEGPTDVPVAEALIRLVGREPRAASIAGGKRALDPRIARWNQPSNRSPFLVLRDWDVDDEAACVPAHVRSLLGPRPGSRHLALRIPVRAIEAWLMADGDGFCRFFFTGRVLAAPDDEMRPKLALVAACRSSTRRAIREAIVPRRGSGRAVGPLYETMVSDFASNHWSPERARANSPSLDRAIGRMQQLVADGIW